MNRNHMRAALLTLLLWPVVALGASNEPVERVYTEPEVVDLLLEGLWFDLFAYERAINEGDSVSSSWLFISINRYMVLAAASNVSSDELTEKSLEAICLVIEDEELLDSLKSRPGGELVSSWLGKSTRSIRERVHQLQESYGGGTGCSVTNENGQVYSFKENSM